jgi:hypothetical protein
MSLRSTGLVAAAVLFLTASAGAHHNMSALFDFNDRVTLQGTITKIDWRNPHIYVFVEAKDPTGVHEWSIEGPPPGFFRARDINKIDFENAIGKPVTAEASRARNGSNSGLLRMLTLPDGKVVSACPQNC